MIDEVRIVNPVTGAEKGSKPARFSLIPAKPHWELAEHYGKGSLKYSDWNWAKGYDWSLSIDALERHLNLFKQGEDIDPETGSKHVIAVAWHALALAQFMDEHPELDDRHKQAREADDDVDWDVPDDEDIDYWPGFLDQDLRPGDVLLSRASPTAPVYFLEYDGAAPYNVRTVTSLEDPHERGLHYFSEITHVNGMPVEPTS